MSRKSALIRELQKLAGAENTGELDARKTGSDHPSVALGEARKDGDWAGTLGCSVEQLREALKAVGRSAEDVRHYIEGKGKSG